MNRIKYWLFCWLLGDICRKSDCISCRMAESVMCAQNHAYVQARRAWKIGRYNNA